MPAVSSSSRSRSLAGSEYPLLPTNSPPFYVFITSSSHAPPLFCGIALFLVLALISTLVIVSCVASSRTNTVSTTILASSANSTLSMSGNAEGMDDDASISEEKQYITTYNVFAGLSLSLLLIMTFRRRIKRAVARLSNVMRGLCRLIRSGHAPEIDASNDTYSSTGQDREVANIRIQRRQEDHRQRPRSASIVRSQSQPVSQDSAIHSTGSHANTQVRKISHTHNGNLIVSR